MKTYEQFNVRLPGLTLDCIDLVADTYGMTKTQVIILAVDRLTRDLMPDAPGHDAARARTEAYLLADKGDETGEVEQA